MNFNQGRVTPAFFFKGKIIEKKYIGVGCR